MKLSPTVKFEPDLKLFVSCLRLSNRGGHLKINNINTNKQ